jgi:hypothetical protein
MWGKPLDTCMLDVRFREKFQDALSVVISDQERAGLDILTHGDFHLDEDLAGRASRNTYGVVPVFETRAVAVVVPHPASTLHSGSTARNDQKLTAGFEVTAHRLDKRDVIADEMQCICHQNSVKLRQLEALLEICMIEMQP